MKTILFAAALVATIAAPALADDRGRQGYAQSFQGNRGDFDNRSYNDRGYDDRGYNDRGYNNRGYDGGGYYRGGQINAGFDNRGFNNQNGVRGNYGYRGGYYNQRPVRFAGPGIYYGPRGYAYAPPIGVRRGFYRPGYFGRQVIVAQPIYGGPVGYYGGPGGYYGGGYGAVPIGYYGGGPGGYYGGGNYDPCRSSGAGAVIGAIAGGLIGNGVAGYYDRGLGTVIGAGLGAVTGTAIERNGRCGY